jgi:hypothetical protein
MIDDMVALMNTM